MKKIIALFLTVALLVLSYTASLAVLNINASNTSETETHKNTYKYAAGTYVGDDHRPCSLAFDFVPIMVIVCPEGEEPTPREAQELMNGSRAEAGWNNGFIWLGESEIIVSTCDPIEIDSHYDGVKFSLYGNTIVWEGSPDFAQNVKGETYRYFAIGY